MKKPGIIAAAFLFQLLLGNLCLITVAEAMMDTMDPEVVTHASERDLEPMSKREPSTCPWAVQDVSNDAPAQTPCDSGKCFAPPSPVTGSPDVALSEVLTSVIALPPSTESSPLPSTDTTIPRLTERPPPLIAVATVVLRQ